MKEMLKLIVETDKASRLDVQKAIDEREALTESLANMKDEIYQKYKDKAHSHVDKVKEGADAEVAQAKVKINEKTNTKKAELSAIYEKEHENWEKHIVSAVTEK